MKRQALPATQLEPTRAMRLPWLPRPLPCVADAMLLQRRSDAADPRRFTGEPLTGFGLSTFGSLR